MKKSFATFLLFVITWSVFAQQEKIDYQTISRIKDEGFNRSMVMDNLFNITDVTGPRLTGSTNLRNAQQWIMDKLKEWGLQNVHLEPWGTFGKGWEVEKSYVAMTAPYYQPLIAAPKAWTPGTNGLVKGEVVVVKAATEEDLEKYKGKLKGKIVVISSGIADLKPGMKADARRFTDEELQNLYMDKNLEEDASPSANANRDLNTYRAQRALRQKISKFILDEEAALILSGGRGADGTFFTSNGASYATDAKPVLPELEMSTEHLLQIIRLAEAKKTVALEAEIRTRFLDQDTLQYNVVGEIPGTDKKLKNELVIIGAHLDSWHAATGATDNAAGCAVMMEVMRIIQTLGLQPRRTIRIVLWSAEEQGLFGSKGYVKKHFADPENMNLLPEHALVSAYYNLDNGGGKIRGIYLQGNDALRPVFTAWLEPFADMGATTVTARNTGSTDHVAFDNVGIPGFQFIQDPLDYGTRTHHTNMDTYDRIQKADLMQASIIIASFVMHTANRDEKLPRKTLPKPKPAINPSSSRGTN